MANSKETDQIEVQNQDQDTLKNASRRNFLTQTAFGAGAVALSVALAGCGGSSSSSGTAQSATEAVWRFGIMADTQWPVPDDGSNPNTVALDIANQIMQQFIDNGVKLVVHVGDLCDTSPDIPGEDTWALYAQTLYNAGIGFFPLRGNHDETAVVAAEWQRIFTQNQNGVHNNSPSNLASVANIPATDQANEPIPTKTGSTYTVGANFSSPNPWGNPSSLAGLSYSFDYNNIRFVMLDMFTPPDNNAQYNMGTTISQQQSWISSQLSSRPAGTHGIVFGHKGMINPKHLDTLFCPSDSSTLGPGYNGPAQDAFIESLANNGVHYYFHGHDHIYDRSITTTTDGKTAQIVEITCASDSSKFCIPVVPSPDVQSDVPAFGHTRQTPIRQQVNTVGYYIVTVSGPMLQVDYYAANVNVEPVNSSYEVVASTSSSLYEWEIFTTPALGFIKRETFGYGLNGQQFVIGQGQQYTPVQDTSPNGTTTAILGGTNTNIATDASGATPTTGRPLSNLVSTAWATKVAPAVSDILTLFGMANNLGSEQTDVYTLSMSYSHVALSVAKTYVLAALDGSGNWSNAVDENFGGNKNFVLGPWSANYTLGTYGVDPTTNTVWAVLNVNGTFAVVPGV